MSLSLMWTSRLLIVILLLVADISAASDYPCYPGNSWIPNTNWVYSRVSGKCYMFFPDTMNYSASLAKCQTMLGFPTPPNAISLSKFLTTNDVTGMNRELISLGNNAMVWLDCAKNVTAGQYTWSDGTVVNMTFLKSLATSDDLSGPCLIVSYVYSMAGPVATIGYQIQSSQCNQNASYFCQHNAVTCVAENIPLYSSSVEVLVPPSTTVGSRPFVACAPGTYRTSDLTPSATTTSPGTIPLNYANCTGTQSADLNPFNYNATWVLNNTQTTIEVCLPVSCPPFNGTLINVQSQVVIPPTSTTTTYNFGTAFPVTCITGFVNYADLTTNQAAVTCSQSSTQKQQGVWNPQSNTPCIPLMCNLTQLLAMVPGNSMLVAARNRGNLRVYNVNLQKSSLSIYNNIITIQCNDGFFFSDRTFLKTIICGIMNGSQTQGQWQGYLGTNLPLDSACQSATCTYESITIKPTMNLQTSFYMMDSNGVYQNQTQTPTNPYPYQTKMRFLCITNYSSVNQTPDQNLTCGPQGVWIPNLTPCVSITAALNLGNNLKYLPPPVEAASAQQVGYVVIVILVVFLSLIVILDVSTLNRDIKTMRTNIKNVKRFMNRNKRS